MPHNQLVDEHLAAPALSSIAVFEFEIPVAKLKNADIRITPGAQCADLRIAVFRDDSVQRLGVC
jgi:hypothetical protein